MKPTLALNHDAVDLTFPKIWQPKVDGVRGLNIKGKFVGRSLKEFKNPEVTAKFSGERFSGFDGELYLSSMQAPRLCSDTTSCVNSLQADVSELCWVVFDDLSDGVKDLPYKCRLANLCRRVSELNDPYVFVIASKTVANAEAMEEFDRDALLVGFEGSILRNPDALPKEGRSSKRVQELIRIKRFTDAEAVVVRIVEGRHNMNEAKTNELGHIERSSHAENQVPNGQVGSLVCLDSNKREITVSAGQMTLAERKFYFENQQELVGKTIKYKSFLHGEKDLPRFPVFLSIRSEEDM